MTEAKVTRSDAADGEPVLSALIQLMNALLTIGYPDVARLIAKRYTRDPKLRNSQELTPEELMEAVKPVHSQTAQSHSRKERLR
ncbi:unnamed protein product [Protopolystoma xenopodis]|uniref:Uncharacterized protein n=1 Tax=Protopolystoma xenopodis TaxID=117903 RepID=A0A3S5AX01_9PLAT|nr:unnamed protein product [Protopolystoma xenopodis]